MEVSLVLLAGGLSRRFGSDKSLLHDGEQRIMAAHIRAARACGMTDVLVSSNHPEKHRVLGVPVVADQMPGAGPLAGIAAALAICRGPYLQVLPCDAPNADPAWLQALYAPYLPLDFDVLLPVHINGEEPLFGCYHRRVLDAVEDYLASGGRRVRGVYQTLRVCHIAVVEHPSFVNINTPEDWAQWLADNKPHGG